MHLNIIICVLIVFTCIIILYIFNLVISRGHIYDYLEARQKKFRYTQVFRYKAAGKEMCFESKYCLVFVKLRYLRLELSLALLWIRFLLFWFQNTATPSLEMGSNLITFCCEFTNLGPNLLFVGLLWQFTINVWSGNSLWSLVQF